MYNALLDREDSIKNGPGSQQGIPHVNADYLTFWDIEERYSQCRFMEPAEGGLVGETGFEPVTSCV